MGDLFGEVWRIKSAENFGEVEFSWFFNKNIHNLTQTYQNLRLGACSFRVLINGEKSPSNRPVVFHPFLPAIPDLIHLEVWSPEGFRHLILRQTRHFEAGGLAVAHQQAIGHGKHLQRPETVQHLKPRRRPCGLMYRIVSNYSIYSERMRRGGYIMLSYMYIYIYTYSIYVYNIYIYIIYI